MSNKKIAGYMTLVHYSILFVVTTAVLKTASEHNDVVSLILSHYTHWHNVLITQQFQVLP